MTYTDALDFMLVAAIVGMAALVAAAWLYVAATERAARRRGPMRNR